MQALLVEATKKKKNHNDIVNYPGATCTELYAQRMRIWSRRTLQEDGPCFLCLTKQTGLQWVLDTRIRTIGAKYTLFQSKL